MSDNVRKIVDAVENAALAARSKEHFEAQPKEKDRYGLPSGCPVIPLGLKDSQYYYMDECKQLRILAADKHGRLWLTSLFGNKLDFCQDNWPRYSKPDKDGIFHVIGTDWARVAEALMGACASIGPIDLDKKVRGSGTWLGGDGRLVMHCGNKIFAGEQAFMPGRIGDHVYPAAPALPYPIDEDVNGAPAEDVLSVLKTWNWVRPDVDPHLMLGWIGAALMGGALDWRPLVWVTGDKATGKSTLQNLVKYIITESALISSVDASAAGIRQKVGNQSLPVALDELEASEDNRKGNDIVSLARYACSGGQSLRGGSDHKGTSFTLMNCFMFSSILIPPLLGQDVSRMAVLNLDTLPKGSVSPALKPDYYKQIGMALRRRLMDRWPDFHAVLEGYKMALASKGHGGRSADQFGTLLACHDILLYDEVPCSDALDEWAERLDYSGLAEAADDLADWERCLDHILTSQVDFFRRGERKIVADIILAAAGKSDDISAADANKSLRSYGMAVHTLYSGTQMPIKVFRIANAHQGLRSIFKDTHWGDRSGASGVWAQSLRRVPGAIIGKGNTSFAGSKNTRFLEIPLDRVIDNNQRAGGEELCQNF